MKTGNNKFLIFIYGFNLNEHEFGDNGHILSSLGTYGLLFDPLPPKFMTVYYLLIKMEDNESNIVTEIALILCSLL